jgi:hypothetical protein
MPDVKIQIKIGSIEFSGEGEKGWIGQQLDKILTNAQKLATLAAPLAGSGSGGKRHPTGADPSIAQKTLAAFLKEKNATSNQNNKFLATAVWLEAKGSSRMTTTDITKALRDSNQSRLGNPSECLNQNVGKGYCEKDGKQFFVTDDGKASL